MTTLPEWKVRLCLSGYWLLKFTLRGHFTEGASAYVSTSFIAISYDHVFDNVGHHSNLIYRTRRRLESARVIKKKKSNIIYMKEMYRSIFTFTDCPFSKHFTS